MPTTAEELAERFGQLSSEQKKDMIKQLESLVYVPTIDHEEAQSIRDAFEAWLLDETNNRGISITSETVEHISQAFYYVMMADSYKRTSQT